MVLRGYLRQRQMLLRYAGQHIQHMQKALEQMNVKLAEVVSGAISLSSQSGDFDEDPDWHFQVDAEQDPAITGLWRV